ncbi:hypothetical protein KPL70_017078 [Citrus sinensis]|nr:hypothetical protein KPL70_017078 [Citrus sinensis]
MASSASEKIAMAAMEEGDLILDSSAEVTLDSQECFWHDKHRPRKPNLKTKAPTYSFEEDTESTGSQTCIIRFHAGPPYEDIAFGIVNREWEYSSKQGFKCTFERGMLQLHFNFKRLRYRR